MYNYVRVRLNKAAGQLGFLPRALSLVWAAAPGYTFAWAVLLILQGILPATTVYLTRALVNLLVAAVRAGGPWARIRPVLVLASVMAVVLLLMQVFRGATNLVSTTQAELTTDHISQLIHEKSATIDLAFHESPDSYDHLHRARAEGSYRPIAVIESLGGLLQSSITVVAMIAVLVPFGPVLPIALVLSTVPALYVVLNSSQHRYEWHYRHTAAERRCWYYDWLFNKRRCRRNSTVWTRQSFSIGLRNAPPPTDAAESPFFFRVPCASTQAPPRTSSLAI